MPYRTLASLLLVTLLCTCDRAHEDRSETDDYGYRTDYQILKESGERDGPARQFGPDGTLLADEQYVAGKLDGLRTAYYPNGTVELEETYRAGQFDGPYATYDSLGNVRLRGQYTAGTMTGNWMRYWPDGTARDVVAMDGNRENGAFREWYANGAPRAAGTYADGKEQGTLWQFDESGTLTTVRDCQAGICTALWRAEEGGTPPYPAPDMTRPAGATE